MALWTVYKQHLLLAVSAIIHIDPDIAITNADISAMSMLLDRLKSTSCGEATSGYTIVAVVAATIDTPLAAVHSLLSADAVYTMIDKITMCI